MNLNLIRAMSKWEVKRTDRLALEAKYAKYTGRADIVELHVPYTHWEDAGVLLENAKKIKGKKILILAGDSLNLDMFSRFYQTSSDRSKPSEEIKTLVKFMKCAEKVYDKIVFMISNHENRLVKVIKQYVMHKEIADEVLGLMSSYTDIFKENKLNKIEIVNHYLLQIGNVLVCHLEHNSAIPGATRRALVQYLIPRINKPWDIAFQAHTHCQGSDNIDGKKIIETGCLIDALDYWVNGKISGKGKLSTLGYATFNMTNGVAKLSDCRYIETKWQGCI